MKDLLATIDLYDDDTPGMADGGRIGFKRGTFRGQKTIQKRVDGVLTYQKKGSPTKTYDPKDYGSEDAAFKAAQADVEESRIAKTTAAKINIDIDKVKKLRSQGLSINKIADLLGLDNRTISNALIEAGETTKNLKVRTIPLEIQKDIKAKYSSFKNWDFNKFTYGISPTADSKLYDKIRDFVDDPKPYEIAGDFSKAEGWLAQQMNRSYKLGNKNYIPIKATVNNKKKIIGFIDNTEFGGGGKYIVNEKFIKGKNADGISMSLHPDYADTAKFVDISKKAKLPVQGVLKDLLKNEGVDTTRISLSDLFKYMKGEVGIAGTKNALERHHISGVKNRATGNYQLLDRDLNVLAREIESEIIGGDTSRVGELTKKGAMVEVGGQTYGSGPKTPEGQFKRFEKQITDFYKGADIKQVKGLSAFMKNLGIKCQLSSGINCMNPQAYEKSLNELSTKAQAGDQAAAAKITNFTKSLRGAGNIIKGALGPAALVIEAGIAVPLGLFEYSQGKPATEIVNSLTYGLFGKSRDDRLRELDPTYGQAENLQNIGERVTSLERLQKGTKGQRIRSKSKFQKADEEFKTALKPFLDTGDPEKAYLENLKKSQDLRQKLIDEDIKTKEDRKTKFDLSDPFMAAGGGIAKEAGDSSGPPPESGPMSQGLQGLMKRVRNL
jgi:hypothetical protein